MSTERLFETALGILELWYIKAVRFEEARATLTIAEGFMPSMCLYGVAGGASIPCVTRRTGATAVSTSSHTSAIWKSERRLPLPDGPCARSTRPRRASAPASRCCSTRRS